MEDGFCNGGICREEAYRPGDADRKKQTGINIREERNIPADTPAQTAIAAAVILQILSLSPNCKGQPITQQCI